MSSAKLATSTNVDLLAQVVLDKLTQVKTVVNKLHNIDSVYRNFELEILAGEPNTVVKCRESKATFEFDLAKVYWNPRLSMYYHQPNKPPSISLSLC